MIEFSNNNQSNSSATPNHCPNLGLKDDALTLMDYPSEWNYCHHVSPERIPEYQHQRTYCLSANHQECPVFTAIANLKMPSDIRLKQNIFTKMGAMVRRVITIIVLIGLLAVIFLYRGEIRTEVAYLLLPAWQKTQMAAPDVTVQSTNLFTATAIITPTGELEATSTQMPIATETPVPTVTFTRPAPVLDLGVPIGGEYRYVIHWVNEGETLQIIANRFNTTPDAIQEINNFLTQVLWADSLVVVPVDNENVDGLPVFEPYQVDVNEISVEDLAEELQIDLEAFIYHNHLWPGYILRQGNWVILPYDR